MSTKCPFCQHDPCEEAFNGCSEPQQQSWEERFDSLYPYLDTCPLAEELREHGSSFVEDSEELKSFIRGEKEASTLQERTRIVKLVEGMVFPCAHKHETCTTTAPCIHKNGKEEAREEILKSISTNENGV